MADNKKNGRTDRSKQTSNRASEDRMGDSGDYRGFATDMDDD